MFPTKLSSSGTDYTLADRTCKRFQQSCLHQAQTTHLQTGHVNVSNKVVFIRHRLHTCRDDGLVTAIVQPDCKTTERTPLYDDNDDDDDDDDDKVMRTVQL